jgi:hypothetical protein
MKVGVKITWQLCETFKGTLPFPGKSAAGVMGDS